MRKPDVEVKEVTCYETGKPMPKIPLWMAGMKVKFVSDEGRQKHSASTGIPELDIAGKADMDDTDDLDKPKAFGGLTMVPEEEGFGTVDNDGESEDAAEEDPEA